MSTLLAAQLIGFLAMLLLFATYQVNDRRIILIFHICISICWIAHYGLLGAASGLVINVICFLRNILFYYRGKNKWTSHNALPVLICILEVGLTLAVWNGPVDLLAIIGAPLQTIALWVKSTKRIRRLMLAASPMWFIYDFMHASYVGMVTETIVMLSIVISMVRYDRKDAKEA